MMFDPPDYPYKDLADTLRDSSDDYLFSNECTILTNITNTGETNKSYHENHSGRYFINTPLPVDNACKNDKDQSAELLVIRSENLLNYEPTLLDDNTVNQFLVPLQNTTSDKQGEDEVPDLLALQSCVLCHEIFTSEADLLDHTISVHTMDNDISQNQHVTVPPTSSIDDEFLNLGLSDTGSSNVADFATEWLVCCTCERVLSTAVEDEITEPLCCNNSVGSGRVNKRKLDTMYVCDFCNGLFADGGSLDKHKSYCTQADASYQNVENGTNVSHDNSPLSDIYFNCHICEKRCNSAEDLMFHSNSCPPARIAARVGRHAHNNNSSSKMWNCGSCNQLFATARELYRHKRGEDRPPGAPLTAYVCEECDKVLGSMCALHTHRKMHKVTKPGYPCRICGRRFNQSGHLAIHMRMHTGERPYPCDLCSKAFKVKVERDDHRRTHTGERPFACTACPKTFTAAARLREHARIHTDQRPYRCGICGAAFRRPYARTVHTLIHTGEKPHECDICGTAFRRSGDMWKHKRTIHGTQLAGDDGKM